MNNVKIASKSHFLNFFFKIAKFCVIRFYQKNDWDPTHKAMLQPVFDPTGNFFPDWNNVTSIACAGPQGPAGWRQNHEIWWQNHENRSNSSISFSKSLNFATLGCLFHDGPQGATVHREAVWDGTYTEGNTASDVTWVFEKQKHQFDTKVVKFFIKDSI